MRKIEILVVILSLLLLSACVADGIKCRVTSYTASVAECGKSDGITASGVKVRPGMVAADWRVFPPGTVLRCDETKEIWVVGDVGGAIKGRKIDRYIASRKDLSRVAGGTLTVSVIHRPESYTRKTAKLLVMQGFEIRNSLVDNRSMVLVSRGGGDRTPHRYSGYKKKGAKNVVKKPNSEWFSLFFKKYQGERPWYDRGRDYSNISSYLQGTFIVDGQGNAFVRSEAFFR